MEVVMNKDKVTPNAVRYAEPRKENDPHNKNIYMTKSELTEAFGDIPETIKVTIEKV